MCVKVCMCVCVLHRSVVSTCDQNNKMFEDVPSTFDIIWNSEIAGHIVCVCFFFNLYYLRQPFGSN